MKSKLFDIIISVETDGENVTTDVTCVKEGKNLTQDALEGETLAIACECLRHTMGVFASRYLYEMKEQGVISEEDYNRALNRE